MKTPDIDRALAEVWEWRKSVSEKYENRAHLPVEEQAKASNEDARKIMERHNLKLPVLTLERRTKS